MKNSLYVVDLDGTLLRSNSFYFFLNSVILMLLKHNIFSFFYLIYKIFLRKFRFIKHEDMVRILQFYWSKYFSQDELSFINKKLNKYLEKNIRTELLNFLKKIKKRGDVVILSTAAASEYSSLISERYTVIDKLHATPFYKNKNWFHNKGESKVKQINLLNKNKKYKVICFTDHIDDLALIKICSVAYLFPPIVNNLKSIKTVSTKLINFYE